MDTSWQVACLIRTENKYYINKKQDQIRLERSRSCSWFLDSNEHENVGWNTFVPVGPKKLFSSTQKRFQTWPSDWCRKSVASRSRTYFFIWENFKSLTGVACEKLQDADADGHPLGWRRKKQHFELNELLLGSGSCVGGVVGSKMPHFSVFGDTVQRCHLLMCYFF